MIAPDPFHTKKPISERGVETYRAIAARLAALYPPVVIERHIAADDNLRFGDDPARPFSTLEAGDSTLDGINFRADDPALLATALRCATNSWGRTALTSMTEDPQHWALKASFGKTIGTGWREVWREVPFNTRATVPEEPGRADDMMKMRFGNAGNPIRFTALHCAVHETRGECNIHIDDAGFMLALPKGVALTADFYGHLMNELLFKTIFRDWLSGKASDGAGRRIINEVVRRVSFNFINSSNGFAGLDKKLNGIKGRRDGIFTAARIIAPMGMTIDLVDRDFYKVQVTGTRLDGENSITVTIGGVW